MIDEYIYTQNPQITVSNEFFFRPNIEEDFLSDAFAQHGQVKAFKFFP